MRYSDITDGRVDLARLEEQHGWLGGGPAQDPESEAIDREIALTQPQVALRLANRKRSDVATFKRELESMPREQAAHHLAAMLDDPPASLEHAVLYRLLVSVPLIGHTKASKVLRDAGVHGSERRIRDMSLRQRTVIAERLRGMWS